MKKTIAFAAVVSLLTFTACSKSADSSDTTADATATEEHVDHDHDAAEEDENVASADNTVLELTITGGDDMKFDQTTLKATAGQTIKLTLVHSGKLPKASMGHNFVLLKNGVNETDFATKALAAKDTDYIPASASGDIIAHTDLIGGGESTTIEFTAPERGAYTFICTFPGHSALMKGKLMVQ